MSVLPYTVVCESDDPFWHEARRTGIGASEAPALIGEHRNLSLFRLYNEKIGAVAPDPEIDKREDVMWGKRMEALILDMYRERSGRSARRSGALLRSKRYPWALCTLDGWTVDGVGPHLSVPWWPLEIKNANEFKSDEWAEGLPRPFVVQVQWQMLVTEEPRGTLAACIGGHKLAWDDVPRDETLIRKLVYHGERFWDRVQRREQPETDGSEATEKAIKELYPADDGTTIELPRAMLDDVEELAAIKDRRLAAEKREKELTNAIKAALGRSSCGIFAGSSVRVTLSTEHRAGHTVRPSTVRTLRIKDPTKALKPKKRKAK